MTDPNLNIRVTADTQQAKQSLNSFKTTFTELSSAVNLGMMAFQAFRDAAIKAFEMGQAGAELERTAGQLDNLAVSIGTTSDALIEE